MFNYNFSKLSYTLNRKSGRNRQGRITIRHKGGGSSLFKFIDYKKYIWNIPGILLFLVYDSQRTSWLGLVSFFNGIITYIILAQYLGLGSIIETGYFAKYLVGNSFYLKDFSNNSKLFNLELYFGKGAQFIRSSGTFGIFLGFLNDFKVIIKLPSKKVYFVPYFCIATLGQVFYIFKKYKNLQKAGYSRRRGIRPSVRGVAMNSVDHPHGGGEGKSSGGRPSVSPWGKITK